MNTLPAYLDAVEQGRIPADEIAHETRLARTAFKLALAEAAAVARDEGGAEIHALHIEQHFRFREALGIDKHEGDSDWMDDPPDLLKSTSAMRNGYDTLIVLTSHVVARAVAEAVRAEREACARTIRTLHSGGLPGDGSDFDRGYFSAARVGERAIRSRPSPDVTVVPPVNDAAQSMIDSARGIGPGSWTSDDVTVPAPPPPDLAVMRRVVEAARAYIDTVDNIIASAADGMPTKVFEQQAREHRGALKLAVSALDGRAQEADHVR